MDKKQFLKEELVGIVEEMLYEVQYAPMGEKTKARKELARTIVLAIIEAYKLSKEKHGQNK